MRLNRIVSLFHRVAFCIHKEVDAKREKQWPQVSPVSPDTTGSTMRRVQKLQKHQMAIPGMETVLEAISMEMPPATASDEMSDDYLAAILAWGQSHGYEPRIAAPRHAGELLRIVMERPEGEAGC